MNKNEKTSKTKLPVTAGKHRKAEETAHQPDEGYRTLLEDIEEGYFEVDLAGNFTFFNDVVCRGLGYFREELMGMNNRQYTDKEDVKRVYQACHQVYETGEPLKGFRWQVTRRDGTKRYLEGSVSLLKNSSGKPTGFRGIAHDITGFKRMEEKLRLEEQRFRLFVEHSSDVFALLNPEGVITYINPAVEKVLGFKPEERIGARGFELVHPDDMKILAEAFKVLIEDVNAPLQQGEVRFRHRDGSFRTLEMMGSNLVSNNVIDYVIINYRDITERKQAEKLLEQSETQYRLLADHMKDYVWLMDMNLKMIYVSPSVERTMGYTLDDLKELPLDKLLMPASFKAAMDFFAIEMPRALVAPPTYLLNRTLELEYIGKDGQTIWGEASFGFIRDENGNPVSILGESRNITERKQMEDELRASESNFRHSLNDSPLGVRISTIEGETIYANRTILDIYGYDGLEELKKISIKDRYTPESYAEWQARKKIRLQGEFGPSEYEISIVRKNGEIRHLYVFRKEIFWDGAIRFQVYYNDITKRKRAEEEKQSLEERLNRAEKMEALGQLAGGVAHDLNNVLGILSGYSELLLMEIPEGQKARGHAEKILQSTQKGAAIIQDLLTLARRGVTASDVVNLNDIVSGFLKAPVFENIKNFHPRVTFRTEGPQELLNIKGSPVHLEKTLVNLVSNAVESISGAGEVTIRTENRYLDKPISGYDAIKEGDYAVLAVSDTGMGVPDEHKEKIFEPFYTKKKMGKSGTGLGLAIVWGTVKDHNGYIDVQTEVGKGTTFTLYFPITREELTVQQQKMPIEQYMGHGELVLVVDDIAEQREVASGLLKKLGYQVHVVSGGEEAVEYLKGNKADILILDMIMEPGIDGLETYQRALKIHPQQKAILVSGFSETDRVRKAQNLGAVSYIRKPYVMEKIGVAIRDELKR